MAQMMPLPDQLDLIDGTRRRPADRAGNDLCNPDTGEVPNGGEVLAPEDDCVCIYDNLEEKVPFDEAKDFEEQQVEAESGQDIEIPDNIAAIIDDCTSSSGDS